MIYITTVPLRIPTCTTKGQSGYTVMPIGSPVGIVLQTLSNVCIRLISGEHYWIRREWVKLS